MFVFSTSELWAASANAGGSGVLDEVMSQLASAGLGGAATPKAAPKHAAAEKDDLEVNTGKIECSRCWLYGNPAWRENRRGLLSLK